VVEVAQAGERSKEYRVMDLDGHFTEPDSLWSEYLPSKYRDLAPRTVFDSLGRKRRVMGNETLSYVDFGGMLRSMEAREAADPAPDNSGSDPHVRLSVMDAEGFDTMVMYPTIGLHFGAVHDIEAVVALCQAYNNWARDFCSVAPDRLIAQAAVPQRSITETRKEIDRAVGELGMRGVFLRPNPVGPAIEDPAWEQVWSQIEDYDVPLGFHEGTGAVFPRFGSDRTDNYMFQHAMSHPYEHMAAMLSLICGGVLERHPNLRVVFAEAGCGWVPYWLERMDHHVDEFAYRNVPMSLRPTEYFKRQCIVTMDSEEGAVVPAFISCLGADNLGWSTDFPHVDHTWRGTVGQMMDRSDLTESDKAKVMGGNSARVYKMAPRTHASPIG
jgi:predicted TIM-barrel fold metal-dependent hydrolase